MLSMSMHRFARSGSAALFIALAGAGCVSTPSSHSKAPDTVEGRWLSKNGVSVSHFSGGAFRTEVRATGEQVARGDYSIRGDGSIALAMILWEQFMTEAQCHLTSVNDMECLNPANGKFALTRMSSRD